MPGWKGIASSGSRATSASTPCWTSSRPANETWTHQATEEITDDGYRRLARDDALRPRDPDDEGLQRASPSGVQGPDTAEPAQALARGVQRLVASGLRDRPEGGRRLSLRVARPRRRRDGDAWRLPRDRPARADRPDGVVRRPLVRRRGCGNGATD